MTAIYNAVKINQRNHILDLGPCVAANFNFFSQLGCHFHFEGFDHAIDAWLSSSQENSGKLLDSFLSDLPDDQKFDIVLIWDLLSFLPPDIQIQLYQRLARYIKPNTLIFTTNYVGNYRPASPATFKVVDQYFIDIETTAARQVNLSKITTLQRQRSLPDFQILHSFINLPKMQGGLTEQILCYRPDAFKQNRIFSDTELSPGKLLTGNHYKTPALELIAKTAEQSTDSVLLDLGPRSNVNLQLWKSHFSEVFNTDLSQALQRISTMDTEHCLSYLSDGPFVRLEPTVKLDAIIAWDTINYFNAAQWAAFFLRLKRHFKSGTLLYLLAYNRETIPARPQSYVFTKNQALTTSEPNTDQTTQRKTPPLNSIQMQRMMPGFYVKQSFTAKPGMQKGITEYLLEYKDQERLDQEKAELYAEVMKRRRERGEV